MGLFDPGGREAAAAVAALCYTNPFTARRIELERRVLGPAFVNAQTVWSRTSVRFANPNVAGLQARTRELLGRAHARLAAGHDPTEDERDIYAGLVRYHLFDHFEEALTRLVDDALGGAIKDERVAFYDDFRQEAERCYGVHDAFAAQLVQVPHLFATSVQVRLSFVLIFQSLLGTSRAAVDLRAAIWCSIFTHDMRRYDRLLFSRMHEIPTLVLGPSGTGKELVARAIGKAAYVPFDEARGRFEAPLASDFRALNLTAMSPGLIESELFGHCKGAFTGADVDRKGFFELCTAHGAVFLDEIGDLAPQVQLKLLRVLQSRQFERVGDAAPCSFDGRVIAATHRDIPTLLEGGAFRTDLFYRLCAHTIYTPSLAEQLAEAPGDLPAFVEIIVERVLGEGEGEGVDGLEGRALVDEVVAYIERLGSDYPWTGNVRELEQCVRSHIVQRGYAPLERSGRAGVALRTVGAPGRAAEHAPGRGPNPLALLGTLDLSADALLDSYCAAQHARLRSVPAVAEKLGLHPQTVRKRLRASGHLEESTVRERSESPAR